MSPSYPTYGAAQVAPIGTLPVAGPLAVPAFQMPLAPAAGLPMPPAAAAAASQQAVRVRNVVRRLPTCARALGQNYPQLTVPTADGLTQVALQSDQRTNHPIRRPAESLHEALGNIPAIDSAAQANQASTTAPPPPAAAAQTQPTTAVDSIQTAAGQVTASRPLVLKDPKCTVSFVSSPVQHIINFIPSINI